MKNKKKNLKEADLSNEQIKVDETDRTSSTHGTDQK
jgi:hypothetical protein